MNLQIEALADHHQLDGFRCGKAELDDWLRRHSSTARGQGVRTYVLVSDEDDGVVGYFAVAPHHLAREAAPPRIARGAPALIPAILLAKLALDESLHGKGFGAELLVCCLETVLAAARVAGGKILVVDAIDDDAARFYEHHDFTPLPEKPHRLVLKLSTAAKALGVAWP